MVGMVRVWCVSVAVSLWSVAGLADDLGIRTSLERVETPAEVVQMLKSRVSEPLPFDTDPNVILDSILNFGKKIWDVIAANQPVADVNFDYANALPEGVTDSSQLSDFSDLQHVSYRMSGVNGFGSEVYNVVFTLVHQYGGRYNGKGRYLETVSIIPSKVDVMWGYTVNFNVEQITATNVGTSSDPIGALAMGLKFNVSTILKKSETNILAAFRGDKAEVDMTTF